jgi:hypothetical protein
MLKAVYGDGIVSRMQGFEWFKRIKNGKKGTNYNVRSGQPKCSVVHGVLGECQDWFISMEKLV